MGLTKLSVIIPCYNDEKYIEECVESVLSQNIDGVEVIIVEDASTDNSLEICRKIEKKHTNIRLLCHENNQGQEQTRNDGLSIIQGEWILFLDGDDVLAPNVLNLLLEKAHSELDIVISRFLYYDELTSYETRCGLKCEEVYSSKEIAKAIGNDLPWDMVSCTGNKLYNSKLINDKNIRFNKNYKYNEDGAFAVEALMNAQRMIYVDVVSYCYRQNNNGVMRRYKKNAFITLNKVNTLLEAFFERYGLGEHQQAFIQNKRFENLNNSINSEVQFGTKNGFHQQIDLILNNPGLVNQLESMEKGNNISELDKQYVVSLLKRKYDFIITYERNRLSNKLFRMWLQKEKTKNGVYKGLLKKGIKNVGIYGAGDVGRLLAAEMVFNGISVDFFLDINETHIVNQNIPCINPFERIPNTEILINSVLTWSGDIQSIVENKTATPMISIWELLV